MRLPPWRPPPPATESVLRSVGQALVFVRHTPSVRRILLFAGLIGLVAMPFQAFLPALARDALGAGPAALGWLTSAVGVGAIIGALGSSGRLAIARPALTLIMLVGGLALGLFLLSLSQTLIMAMAALALIGLTSIAFMSIANASVQLGTPEAIVGRVMGLWVVLNAGSQPVGSLIEGAIAERWGLLPMFALAAAVCGLAALWLLVEQFTRRVVRPPLVGRSEVDGSA
jgi:predicted MFS family arabinose efflux permease